MPARRGRCAAPSAGDLAGRRLDRRPHTACGGPGCGANGRKRTRIPIEAGDAGVKAPRASKVHRRLRATDRTDADNARRGPTRYACASSAPRSSPATPAPGGRVCTTHPPTLGRARPPCGQIPFEGTGRGVTGKDRPAPVRIACIPRPCSAKSGAAGGRRRRPGAVGRRPARRHAASGITARGETSPVRPGRLRRSASPCPARGLAAGGSGVPDRRGFGGEPVSRPGASDTGGWSC